MKSKGQTKVAKLQPKGQGKTSKSSKSQIHIGRGAVELALFEFQHAAILHAIRLGERPKSMTEIQHFSNRRDIANIQYSIRKLVKAGLVQKAKRDAGRGTFYELTKYGFDITEAYVIARTRMLNEFLSEQTGFVRDAENATRLMTVLTGIYDHLSRTDTMRMVAAE